MKSHHSFIIIYFLLTMSANANLAAKSYVDGLVSAKLNTGDLAGIIAAAITGKEDASNKITILSGTSTNIQYPSAKTVYDALNTKVANSGNETIGGVKTFSAIPLIPTAALPSR